MLVIHAVTIITMSKILKFPPSLQEKKPVSNNDTGLIYDNASLALIISQQDEIQLLRAKIRELSLELAKLKANRDIVHVLELDIYMAATELKKLTDKIILSSDKSLSLIEEPGSE